MRRRVWLCLSLCSSLAITNPAAARAGSVRLVWERAPGSVCPPRRVLEQDVEAIMGRAIFDGGDDAAVVIRGQIEEYASGVTVTLRAKTASGTLLGERTLTVPAGECASLREPIDLVLTLFVDQGDEALERAGENRFGFGASSSVLTTPLPRATLSIGPSLSLELGSRIRLRLDGAWFVPVTIETPHGVGANMQAWSVSVRACARVFGQISASALGVCLGGELGALIAVPQSLPGPGRQTRLLAHGSVDLRWEKQLARAALLDVAVGPLLSFSRPAISYVRGDGERMAVYRPELVGMIFQVAFIILAL